MCSCGLVFFVFKQKTAYEMRISDWSSDVCSSDLIATADSIDVREALVKELIFSAGLPFVVALLGSLMLLWIGITHGFAPLERIRDLLARRHPGEDRKSVVLVKSVSVCVDHGGRSIIKKNTIILIMFTFAIM